MRLPLPIIPRPFPFSVDSVITGFISQVVSGSLGNMGFVARRKAFLV